MKISCDNIEIDVPEHLINKFIEDFRGLPGSGNREPVLQLRDCTWDVIDMISEDPDILEEKEYYDDFERAVAIQEALKYHGILYDA